MRKNKSLYLFFALFIFFFCPFIFTWENPCDGRVTDAFQKEFGNKLSNKYQMKVLKAGCGYIVRSKTVAYDYSLLTEGNWTIDQARPIIIAMLQDFWIAFQDPIIQDQMRWLGKTYKWYDPILTRERLGIQLAFWDKNSNRPNAPYLSRVVASEGTIKYYVADPKDQSLVLFHSEKLELN